MKVAGAGTKRIRRQGGEAIDAAYGGIENFSAKCRNLSDFVGNYVLNSGMGYAKNAELP